MLAVSRISQCRAVRGMPEPGTEQWLELYEAFREYCQLYPWAYFDDSDLVAVELPGGQERGYCIVLGSGGIERGLAVYRGGEGLAGFLAISTGLVDPGSLDALNTTDAVSATLADREDLDKEDRDVIRSLGLRYRGRGRWPLFRSYVPGYFPWLLEADDAVLLAAALRGMTSLTEAVTRGKVSLDHESDTNLFHTLSFEGGKWQTRWDSIYAPVPTPAAAYQDIGRLERLAGEALRSQTTWELGMYYLPAPLFEDKKARPHLPVCAMLVESESGYLLTDLFTQPGASDNDRQELLVKILETMPGVPADIVVNTPRLAQMVESITGPLGINVSIDETPALWSAKEDMFERISDGPPEC